MYESAPHHLGSRSRARAHNITVAQLDNPRSRSQPSIANVSRQSHVFVSFILLPGNIFSNRILPFLDWALRSFHLWNEVIIAACMG